MYNVSVARCGKRSVNRKSKGIFFREFSTLDELVEFMVSVRGVLYFPRLQKELTTRERMILVKKYDSVVRSSQKLQYNNCVTTF